MSNSGNIAGSDLQQRAREAAKLERERIIDGYRKQALWQEFVAPHIGRAAFSMNEILFSTTALSTGVCR